MDIGIISGEQAMSAVEQTNAHSYHHFWNFVDAVAVLGGLSSPAWWHSLDILGQAIILFLTIAGGALRLALLIREWRRGR